MSSPTIEQKTNFNHNYIRRWLMTALTVRRHITYYAPGFFCSFLHSNRLYVSASDCRLLRPCSASRRNDIISNIPQRSHLLKAIRLWFLRQHPTMKNIDSHDAVKILSLVHWYLLVLGSSRQRCRRSSVS